MSDDPLAVEVRTADSVRLEPAEWEARAASMYRAIAEEPDVPREAVAETLRELRLRDEAGATWFYDGMTWHAWDGADWRPGRPTGPLRLEPFTMQLVPPTDERLPPGVPPLDEHIDEPVHAPVSNHADVRQPRAPYRPTHQVPPGGLPAWETPDPAATPVATLDAGLDVMVVEQAGYGWARVVCSNGWSAWVDGRQLM